MDATAAAAADTSSFPVLFRHIQMKPLQPANPRLLRIFLTISYRKGRVNQDVDAQRETEGTTSGRLSNSQSSDEIRLHHSAIRAHDPPGCGNTLARGKTADQYRNKEVVMCHPVNFLVPLLPTAAAAGEL